jgi:hypothetical protein
MKSGEDSTCRSALRASSGAAKRERYVARER